jgi:multisubunit Na+/H+ antiporter MnhF subunit
MIPLLQLLLALTVLSGVARAVRHGSLADRIIGVDVALLGLIGLIAADAEATGRTYMLDVLPLLGLLAVVGTLAGARAVRGEP